MPRTAPLGVDAMHRGAHRRPGVTVAERHIGGQCHRHARVEQRRHPPELIVLGGGDLIEVLITALGNEIRLGNDGDSEVGQIGQAIRRHDGGVFDAVARPGCRRRAAPRSSPAIVRR